MHTFNLVTMTCFILFIEKTILVSGISGVHTIRTTGQLIPFVIGVASLILAARDLVMLSLQKVSSRTSPLLKYPEWERYHLAFQLGLLGTAVQVVDDEDKVVPALSRPHTQSAAHDTAA
jgi:hypothetical protein